MDKQLIIDKIQEEKIIVIVRGLAKDKLIPTAEALYAGGIRLMEITYSDDKNVPDSITGDCIKALVAHFGDKMLIGAGTVLTKEQVRLTKAMGGTFIISPNADGEIIKETCAQGLVSIPGALTPTETVAATKDGADFVKLFPVCSLGTEYVKAIKAPLSSIKLLAVGGIDENNISDYMKSGVSGFGIGSNIIKKDLINDGNFAAITELAKKYVAATKEN